MWQTSETSWAAQNEKPQFQRMHLKLHEKSVEMFAWISMVLHSRLKMKFCAKTSSCSMRLDSSGNHPLQNIQESPRNVAIVDVALPHLNLQEPWWWSICQRNSWCRMIERWQEDSVNPCSLHVMDCVLAACPGLHVQMSQFSLIMSVQSLSVALHNQFTWDHKEILHAMRRAKITKRSDWARKRTRNLSYPRIVQMSTNPSCSFLPSLMIFNKID